MLHHETSGFIALKERQARVRSFHEAFMKKTTDKEEAMRALVVLHKAEGETFRQIGQILHIRPMTAQAAINRYKQSSITGLKTKQSSGRPPPQKDQDETNPKRPDKARSTSLRLPQNHLEPTSNSQTPRQGARHQDQQRPRLANPQRTRHLLQDAKSPSHQPRPRLRSESQKGERLQKDFFSTVKKNVAIGFQDEVWLELCATIAPMWMQKGSQVKIATPGVNKRINVFITMLYPSRALIWDTFSKTQKRRVPKA